jgi:hypothetical protein
MKFRTIFAVACASLLTIACQSDNNNTRDISLPITFDFNDSDQAFVSIFSDYPVGEETFYELEAAHQDMPVPFEGNKGWKLSGNNHSDDLFMAIKAPIDNLESSRLYSVNLEVEFLSNAPQNCFGIGGAPGESVYIKLAASDLEPNNLTEDDMYRINIDKGNQSQSGTQGQTVGDINNGIDCGVESAFSYAGKTLKNETPIDVMSNENGEIWVLAGTDSGFEGKTTIYISKLTVTINE